MYTANHRIEVVVTPANLPHVAEAGGNRWRPFYVDPGIDHGRPVIDAELEPTMRQLEGAKPNL